MAYNSDANGDPVQNLYGFPDSDSMITTRLRRVEKTVPFLRTGSNVLSTAVVQGVTQSAINSSGQVDLASGGVQMIGSVPPAGVTGQFAAITTGTTVTWYWDGTNGSVPLVIHRADGSVFAVPRGTIAISGLANSTTYYFLPFWNTAGACSVSWVIGTVGTPQIAFVLADTTNVNSAQFYLAQQVQQGHEQLAGGFMTQATTSGGTGGGGAGGGGGGGNCVMSGTLVDPLGDYGEMAQGIHGQSNWVRITTENMCCLYGTPDHPIYFSETEIELPEYEEEKVEPWKRRMGEAKPGNFIFTGGGLSKAVEVTPVIRKCSKRSIHLTRGHLFLANGILSHNAKPVNP